MSIQTATEKATEKAAESARQLTGGVLENVQAAVKSTQDAAEHTLEKAQERVSAWQRQADPAIDDMAARAQELATRSIDYCARTGASARQQMQRASEITTKYVAEQPGKSLAIAAASGAAVAALAFWSSRRRDTKR